MTPITEESGVHKAWNDEARSVTLETLGPFVTRLATEYQHDYGTICHALAAAMKAAFYALESSPSGGITGFQAGCVQWEVLRNVFHVEAPARLLNYRDLLYPQYREKFTTISPETWAEVRKLAQENLANAPGHASVTVIAHMQSIAEGVVPFGLTVAES